MKDEHLDRLRGGVEIVKEADPRTGARSILATVRPLRAARVAEAAVPAEVVAIAKSRRPNVQDWGYLEVDMDKGWFHIVRRMMQKVGLPVEHLHRSRIGSVSLAGLGLTEPRTAARLEANSLDGAAESENEPEPEDDDVTEREVSSEDEDLSEIDVPQYVKKQLQDLLSLNSRPIEITELGRRWKAVFGKVNLRELGHRSFCSLVRSLEQAKVYIAFHRAGGSR